MEFDEFRYNRKTETFHHHSFQFTLSAKEDSGLCFILIKFALSLTFMNNVFMAQIHLKPMYVRRLTIVTYGLKYIKYIKKKKVSIYVINIEIRLNRVSW